MYAYQTMIMSQETKTIHQFDFDFICDFFLNTPRQGPGSPEATLRALSFVENLTEESRIADIGCGTGGQTLVLAAHAPGRITGLDLFPRFIDRFNANARELNLQGRLEGITRSMDDLPFGHGELDLIWSEGAIYNIGFERGVTEWHRYLKPGGYLAVTDATWLTDERPAEIDDYWMAHYPQIDTIPAKMAQIQRAGYLLVAAFVLPESCWTQHYFASLVGAQELFLEQYAGDKSAEEFVAFQRQDVLLYERYKTYYGYVFYIARRME